jgi:hypothetical protein
MAAEYARSVGAADRAADRLAAARVRIERVRRKLERMEEAARRQEDLAGAARARAAIMADGLRQVTSGADLAAIAAVRGWKEVHEYGWASKRLTEHLQQVQPEYVSGTDLADLLANEAGITMQPDYDPVRWRSCVRWSLKYLCKRNVVESVRRQRSSDGQWESCWRWKPGATLEDYRRQAQRIALRATRPEDAQ